MLYQFTPDQTFKDDTCASYMCEVIGGHIQPTEEVQRAHYFTADEVRLGSFQVRYKDYSEDGIGMTAGYQNLPLKLVGPEGRLGRMGRMVYDALSTFECP